MHDGHILKSSSTLDYRFLPHRGDFVLLGRKFTRGSDTSLEPQARSLDVVSEPCEVHLNHLKR